MGTTERIFKIMIYICRVRHSTIPELAEKFGVSIRTIKRDVNELGYIIPIETRVGRNTGGVYVMEDYQWNNMYMSTEDIELLIKIKNVGLSSKRLILNVNEIKRLEKIIATYTSPKVKIIF